MKMVTKAELDFFESRDTDLKKVNSFTFYVGTGSSLQSNSQLLIQSASSAELL